MPHALVASPPRWRFARVFMATAMLLAGCKLWQGPTAEPNGPTLSWLSNLVGQASEPTTAPDFSWLKSESRTADVLPGDELEVTVHDLFEPGKPHTWTARVTPTGHADVPLLGRVVVSGGDPQQIAESLADRYRAGDVLLDPHVQVRQLNQPTVSVRIDGEVYRPETAQLPRAEASVHRALAEAGGAKGTAGTHISIRRRSLARDDKPADSSVVAPSSNNDEVVWFDTDRDSDRKTLRDWRLAEGDVVTFHPAVAPVRIAGAVLRPGTIKLPAGRQTTLWEIVQLAGGVSHSESPCTLTLIRPAKDVHGPQRWSFPVESWSDAELSRFPNVEPGDTIHVAATTSKRSRRHARTEPQVDDVHQTSEVSKTSDVSSPGFSMDAEGGS